MAEQLAARKDGQWRIIGLTPDMCLTPGVASPVPYPVTSDLGGAKAVVNSVRLNGKPAFVFNQSKTPTTLGDQAGVNKGVVRVIAGPSSTARTRAWDVSSSSVMATCST